MKIKVFGSLLCFTCFFFILVAVYNNEKSYVEMVKVGKIKSISALSFDQGFTPNLLLDSDRVPENAWHSMVRPKYPQ